MKNKNQPKRNKYRGKICIIDDEPVFVEVYSRKFKDAGYKVTTADSIEGGFDVIRKELPDIVFLDIIMSHNQSGMELLDKCKKNSKTKNIPFVLLTNLDSNELREQGCRIGALYFLKKSDFLPSEVVRLTEEILAVRDYEKRYNKDVVNDKPYLRV